MKLRSLELYTKLPNEVERFWFDYNEPMSNLATITFAYRRLSNK